VGFGLAGKQAMEAGQGMGGVSDMVLRGLMMDR
jgi:hypothetical protein